MIRLLGKYFDNKASELGRRVCVGLLGLGSTNRTALERLLGIESIGEITIRSDNKSEPLPSRVHVIDDVPFGNIYEDVLIPSPSVRRELLELPSGTEFITDYDLIFMARPKNLFLVSGSDGKSTTTAMTQMLLSPRFPTLFTGGNIGTPLFSASLDSDAFLLEMSSFTLRYTKPCKIGRAILTNVTPNHLNWHASLEEYEECKLGLIRGVGEPILNLSDRVSEVAARDIQAFALVSDSIPFLDIIKRYKTEHAVTVEQGAIMLDGKPIVSINQIKRHERHNLQNLASAIALSIGYTTRERIIEVAKDFNGLSERGEVFDKNGISYISSSIDTTPERTRTTLEGLGREVRIILGGRGKGLPLEPLRSPLLKYASKISLYGEAAAEMLAFIEADTDLKKIPHRAFKAMRDAVDYANEDIRDGETVLLSPAATSYGEFVNYLERGRFFKDYIMKNTPEI